MCCNKVLHVYTFIIKKRFLFANWTLINCYRNVSILPTIISVISFNSVQQTSMYFSNEIADTICYQAIGSAGSFKSTVKDIIRFIVTPKQLPKIGSSLVPRPCPAFRCFQYGKAGRAWYLFSCEHDGIGKWQKFSDITSVFHILFNRLYTHSTLGVYDSHLLLARYVW